MSSRDRDHKSGKHKSRELEPSRQESKRGGSNKSISWSDWIWDENGAQWYKWRYDKNGEPEYQLDTTNAAQYDQTKDYATGHEPYETPQAEHGYLKTPLRNDEIRNETKETPFSGPGYINPNCSCGNNCAPGTGCDPATLHGGPGNGKPEIREPNRAGTPSKVRPSSHLSDDEGDGQHWQEHENDDNTISCTASYTSSLPQATNYADGHPNPYYSVANSSNYNSPYNVASRQGAHVEDGFDASSTIEEHPAEDSLSSDFSVLNIGYQRHSEPAEDWHLQQPLPSAYSTIPSIKELPADSHQGTVFGRICDDMGLLKPDKSGGRSNEMSRWNPEGLQNNCIFVSVGYLLNLNAEKLAKYLNVKFPPHIKGLGVGEMEWHLGRMPGLHVVILPFDQGAVGKIPRNSPSFALRFLERWISRYEKLPFAIGYQRADGSGHCLVAERLSQGKASKGKSSRGRGHSGERPESYSYTCYQKRTNGIDMAKDVMNSSLRFAIFVDPDATAMQMDFYYETDVQGQFGHVWMQENGWYSNATYNSSSASNSYTDSGYRGYSSYD